ncbi:MULTISPECIES: PolC-type DNA polymerase III [Thermoanaerobacter]|uniref:DNA polymerase III PolC-type n=2 Tax=Thermoanaerobacter TaxID=1754 RepID=B0K9Q5_THEP3|nr:MULTISPECIES: PolC-type DNA polymerase III [Thermoanaerobacter]ABY94868.1 DNA polymerase III, alpha subunit [Thermoanaerobacter pseudethanolicus ATCC 33223]ADV79817.1 DNA polymerase III, alpha subunit [Thermoanaerobacter brockii subsp. finnii Ako-1]HBW59230.1 PolC-type DNA polymerase III [Thermoanaerobacter sp.]
MIPASFPQEFEIKKVKLLKKERKLIVSVSSNNNINSQIRKFQDFLLNKFPLIKEVEVVVEQEKKFNSLQDILDNFEEIILKISEEYPASLSFLKTCDVVTENQKIIIKAPNEVVYQFIKSNKIDFVLKKFLKDKYGFKTEIDVVLLEEFEDTMERMIMEEDIKVIEEITKSGQKQETGKTTEKMEDKEDSQVLLGKEIKAEVISIKDVTAETEEAVIEGEIFSLEFKELKSKILMTFDITDYTSSILVKAFLTEEKYNYLKENIQVGSFVKLRGKVFYDKYEGDLVISLKDLQLISPKERKDLSEEKRVELHLHTQMSSMDAVASATEVIKRAAKWGHKAIAITDHAVVQAFPEAMEASSKYGVKVIYGVEGYLVDDGVPIVTGDTEATLEDEFTVFDIETTGLSNINDEIIEIGAVKIKEGKIIDTFETFVNPKIPISSFITKLTGIDESMVKDAPSIEEILPKFLEFASNSVLVAHNANFDVSFIKSKAKKFNLNVNNAVLDTLELSRHLYKDLKNYKLDTLADHLQVKLEHHHRAVDDAMATAEIFIKTIDRLKELGVEKVKDINAILKESEVDIRKLPVYHVTILVKDQKGLRNLYEIISKSNLEYFHRTPRIPKSLLISRREGLIIGSACEQGEVFRAIVSNLEEKKLENIISFYDYLEVQPVGNNEFLIGKGEVKSVEELREINRKIYLLGKKYNKLVVATGDVHFLDPWDDIYRKILMAGKGYKDADRQPPLYFKTTDEMLKEFEYLGEEVAKEIVIDNPNKIADLVEEVKPIPDGTFPPVIEGAEEELRKLTLDKAHEIYGDPLPEIVQNRLDRELNSIINNGYAVMYIIAQKLVSKSLKDGYLVGSRGSVGSSLVATMSGITEVNPLPPHYVCPNCKYSEFITDGSYGCGVDMPDKTCPHCGTLMRKDGFDIPFEVFLGFEGDKEPDIDLNFSGEYQPIAHKYTEELFGKGHVFRAGTIGTLADKTAYGYVKKYFEERNLIVHKSEIKRLTVGCTGVKRTTGQHPGGIMVVPKDKSIYDFTPIQHPADAEDTDVITTHFDYHSISGRLLKLDILGHDDPTVIRMLEDLTGINAREIPLDDKKTMSLFTSVEALGIDPEELNTPVGTLGLPEFGTKFVRQMLIDTRPTTFAELVRISGLSHGTDVWLNNAQDIIREGIATLKEVISTRDDIMLYLISKGMDKKLSFKIMENVRKGKGVTQEEIEEMRKHGVPNWFIESCQKIKYMFPKAHAVAYVIMAFRIAYFKVHYPEAFYATYFTVRADDFNLDIVLKGKDSIKNAIKEIEAKGNNASPKEKSLLTVLEVALEMYLRGFKFINVDLYKSDAVKFFITEEGLLPPLNSLEGVGIQAAKTIAQERENGKFLSVEDFRNRTKVSKTVIEILKQYGCLTDLPESNQLSLF